MSGAIAISLKTFSMRSWIAFGVPLGVCTVHHEKRLVLAIPASPELGISLSASTRSFVVTTSARSLPALICAALPVGSM